MAYCTSGLTAMARFAGSVHGVVVQTRNFSGSPFVPSLADTSPASAAGNSTKMLGSETSLYSSSCSASAVWFVVLHGTGRSFLNTSPTSTNFANTSSCDASYAGDIVVYGASQ